MSATPCTTYQLVLVSSLDDIFFLSELLDLHFHNAPPNLGAGLSPAVRAASSRSYGTTMAARTPSTWTVLAGTPTSLAAPNPEQDIQMSLSCL